MNTKVINLKEKIKKLRDELYGIYVDYLSDTKGGKREIDEAILNFIEAEVKAEREDIAQWLEIEIELSGEISSNRALVYAKQLRGGISK